MATRIRTLSAPIVQRAALESFVKLDPRVQWRNPVMFVVWVGSVLVTLIWIAGTGKESSAFVLAVALWLWFTIVFANFAESVAEGRGKAQAAALRGTRRDVMAKKLSDPARKQSWSSVAGSTLRKGDLVYVPAGEVIPGDGEVVEGAATVDESAITGESAPVVRESGGDRSAVTGGTRVLSDWLVMRISANPGETFLDRMIALVEGAKRQRTPNEIALSILLAKFTLIFLFACATLLPFSVYAVKTAAGQGTPVSITVLVALLVCLIPTTIGGLLSAIGIAGMDRMIKANIIATSGRAVEAAGDVDVLLLDKTGTITLGNRQAAAFAPAPGVTSGALADAAQLASLADETPEGRSIVVFAKQRYGLRERDLKSLGAQFIPFSANTRMSGVDLGERRVRKGAADAVRVWLEAQGGRFPAEVVSLVETMARRGSTPLVGDNRLTATAIAAEAGVDDFLAEATPEAKLKLIREHQAQGRLIAMCGDGTNDAPALAQADVAVAMNSGTQAAKEAGNMVDLDSNPTKLIEVVEIGKQLLITRGSLTTFSIANDVAKYFAIIPAAFATTYPQLNTLNVMHLATPSSAILSAVIFNALIIIALIPLALKGVRYRPVGAEALLRRNLLIYGLGGIVVPFIGIKLIDVLIAYV